MGSKLMSLKDVNLNITRSSFDLSHKVCFTSKSGELLPVCTEMLIPGDKIKLNVKSFSRTQPLNTASYVRMREYYDAFFVPMRVLWNRFGTFITQMTNNAQHATSINSSSPVSGQPYITTEQINDYLSKLETLDKVGANPQIDPYRRNVVGRLRSYATKKLLEYLGYSKFRSSDYTGYGGWQLNLNPFPLLAYQKIYYDFYRNTQWENSNPSAFNCDYATGTPSSSFPLSGTQLPIGSLYKKVGSYDCPEQDNLFDLRYANYKKDYFMGLLPNSQFGEEAVVPINVDGILAPITSQHNTPQVFSYADDSVNGSASQMATTVANSNRFGYKLNETFERYGLKRYVDSASLTDFLKNVLGGSPSSDISVANQGAVLSILSLRGYEALQRFREVAQSTSQSYRDQVKKNFGVNVPVIADDCSYFIDGFATNLDISEVVNNNITGDNSAEIAGKGTASGDGYINFEAKEHGIFMIIYHNEPLLDYANQGIDALCLKTQVSDYALPAFDRIGMQQTNVAEFCNESNFVQKLVSNHGASITAPPFLGYAPRYVDAKTSYDVVRGGFADDEAGLVAWTSALTPQYIAGLFSDLEGDLENTGLFTYPIFKVNADLLDSIFAVNVDDTVATDQFLTNCFLDIKKVSNLDYDGLPY